MLEKITEEEIEMYETLVNPVALAEVLFSDYDNLTLFGKNNAHLRVGQYPLMSFEYLLDYDPALTTKDNFKLREGSGTCYCFGGRKFGKCEDVNSKILLADGSYATYRELINSTQSILAFNEQTLKLEKTKAFIGDNGKKECLEIKTRSGKSIIVTKNHPLLTDRGWIEAKDLLPNDFIAEARKYNIKGSLDVDENIAKLLGYLLGDGSTSQTTIGFSNVEDELIKEYKELADYFDCSLRQKGIDYFAKHKVRKKTKNNFQKIVLKYGINKLAKEKTIPEEVFKWKNKYISILLNRLFACDAHVHKKTRSIELTLASKEMIYQVSSLLLRFGIHSDIYEKTYKEFKAWRLFICGDYNKFFSLIGIKSKPQIINSKEYSTCDVIPKSFIEKEYSNFKYKKELSLRKLKAYNPTVDKCKRINKIIENDCLEKLINSDVYWGKIKTIKSVGLRDTAYVEVPKLNTYISNNIISHNTLILEKIDLMVSIFLLGAEKCGFSSYDALHIEGVLEEVVLALENHPILKDFVIRVKRNPYFIQAKSGYTCIGINMNVSGKKPGAQFFQKHLTRLYIEEASFETDDVYKKRIDAVSELGCVERISGMTNFTKYSPPGRMFNDQQHKNRLVNLPQFVNPMWDDEEKIKAIKKHGGKETVSYRVFVEGKVVDEGISVFDMERVRKCYNEDKETKHIEITKENFFKYEELLYLEKPKNSDNIFMASDIGETAPSEIIILFENNDKYCYRYNITLHGLIDDEQLTIFKFIAKKINANVIALDTTEGIGRVIARNLAKEFPEQVIPVGFNKKIAVDFERDDNDNLVLKEGVPQYKEEFISEWSIKRLKDLLYGEKLDLALDHKFDVQFNSVISMQSGNRVVYNCLSEENHLFQAFQVFGIAQWDREFHNTKPIKTKTFFKGGV